MPTQGDLLHYELRRSDSTPPASSKPLMPTQDDSFPWIREQSDSTPPASPKPLIPTQYDLTPDQLAALKKIKKRRQRDIQALQFHLQNQEEAARQENLEKMRYEMLKAVAKNFKT